MHSDREQIGTCPGMGQGNSGQKRKTEKGNEKTFWCDGNHYLDCGDGFMNVYVCQTSIYKL